MKRIFKLSILCVVFVMFSNDALLSSQHEQGDSQKWWYELYPEKFDAAEIDTKLSFISVEGNKFVDENGKRIIFRGVNISDPDKTRP